MFNVRLFRARAFAKQQSAEKLDDLLRVTAPHEWIIVVGLAVVLLGVVAWGVFGSVERSLAADCILMRPGERRAVVSGVAGTVVDVLVKSGDAVKSGQAIARIRLPEVEQQVRVAQAKVKLLEARSKESSTIPLEVARAELLELKAVAAAGDTIFSPYAGEVAVLELIAGQAVTAGAEVAQIRMGDNHRLQAVALVGRESAQHVEVGMAARVLLQTERGLSALDAEVREITPEPIVAARWLTAMGLPARGREVRLDLREPPPSATDGQRGQLLVVTHRHAPVFLLVPGGMN